MDSYLILDGAVLWVLLGCAVTVLIGIIILGCGHIKALKENCLLKLENEWLSHELDSVKYAWYKATFKVPETENV